MLMHKLYVHVTCLPTIMEVCIMRNCAGRGNASTHTHTSRADNHRPLNRSILKLVLEADTVLTDLRSAGCSFREQGQSK